MSSIRKLGRYLLLILAAHAPLAVHAATEIQLLTYYDNVPFVTGVNTGLSYDLAEYLTEKSNKKFHFSTVVLPRLRLDFIIDSDAKNWVVAWAAPEFFGDVERTRFAWSAAFISDADLLVSHVKNPVEMDKLSTMKRVRFGSILGHRYPQFEQLLTDGNLIREDAPELKNNLQKLMARRIDVTIISKSSVDYYRSTLLDFSKSAHVSAMPVKTVDRRFFVDKSQEDLYKFLNQVSSKMADDDVWTNIQKKYR